MGLRSMSVTCGDDSYARYAGWISPRNQSHGLRRGLRYRARYAGYGQMAQPFASLDKLRTVGGLFCSPISEASVP